uniref:Uncharacterized protein n=1 Tax=Anguilla anguilla TaxID=7936 RepID=A0A0E9WUN0_ANGAN
MRRTSRNTRGTIQERNPLPAKCAVKAFPMWRDLTITNGFILARDHLAALSAEKLSLISQISQDIGKPIQGNGCTTVVSVERVMLERLV